MTFFTLLVCLAGATSISPVQKVIQLLDDLKGKVEADLSREEGMMSEYSSWCDEEQNSKEDAITSSKRTVGDLKATIEDSNGGIMTLTSTIEEVTSKISSSEGDLSEATALRNKEKADFDAQEKELVDTADSLSRAVVVLKRNLGLVQSGHVKKELALLTTSLNQVIEASWVTSQQRSVVQSLLQSQAGSEDGDEDLAFQPQAATQAFTAQSGGIVDTLTEMQEKAESSLSSSRKTEMEAAHEYALLKNSLDNQVSVLKKQLSEATLQKSRTQENLHAAQGELDVTHKTLADDTKYLAELKSSCSSKAAEWAARQQDAQAELGAIAKAKEVLSEGVKVFLQTSSKVVVDESHSGVRKQAVHVLKGLAKKYKTFGLVELASRATSDTFGKIRGLIEGMIGKLEEEAAAEADQKSFCDEAIGESKAKQATLTSGLDQEGARIQKAEAGKAKLLENIKLLESEVAEIDAGQAEATKVRSDEHDANAKAADDFRQSAEAVAKAIDVLQKYYSSASFVQTKQAPELGGASTDIGSAITSLLEAAESDFTRLLAETEASESSSQDAFDKLTEDNKVGKATKQTDAAGKGSEVKQLEVALSNYKEDHATLSNEMTAVLNYLDKLKPQCEAKVMTYGEKKARREQEISGLKEALTILADDASFVQIKTILRGARRA